MHLDPDEIRTFRQSSFFEEKKSSNVNPLTIFFAVLAAILVSWLIREAYLEWQVRQAVEIFNQQMANINSQAQRDLQRIQISAQIAQEAVNEKARVEAGKVRLQKLAEHQLKLDRQAAISAERDIKDKKAQAWLNYYKPAKGCESSNANKDIIKCGNDFAKAKKSFEVQRLEN